MYITQKTNAGIGVLAFYVKVDGRKHNYMATAKPKNV